MLSFSARAGHRRRHVVIGLALILPLIAAASRGVAEDNSYLGIFGNWEARVFQSEDDGRQCAARALHAALVDGDVLWVFNTASQSTLHDGYLAVDRRLGAGASSAHIEIDDGRHFPLLRGHDLHFYNAAADGPEILSAMQRRLALSLVLDMEGGQAVSIPVSLIGFTRASDTARLACEF